MNAWGYLVKMEIDIAGLAVNYGDCVDILGDANGVDYTLYS